MILGGYFMAKKENCEGLDYTKSMKDVLIKFDLKALLRWMKKYRRDLHIQMLRATETVQMATMCKMICNRTDMLNTEAHKKAREWLREHNMRGQIF